jgi:1,4-alpha-glucan branching enzyme
MAGPAHPAPPTGPRRARAHPGAERILAQALRELLLAQSSDWLLLLNQGGGDEPLARPAQHLRRCMQLCELAEQTALSDEDHAFLAQVEEEDNPFPYINYRMFTR